MVPTLFVEIYRKHFGTSYDATQESTWCWLTNQNIWDFSTPSYTRDDPPCTCMMKCKGHRPKMFLWMLEEFVYILGCLHEDDRDGCVVLGHELLLLTCSRCCSKRGGGRGSCCSSVLSINLLPACSSDTLEHTVCMSKDTMSLECLAWAVYDNLLVPRKSLSLSGFKSYGQVVQCLVDNVYRGLHSHCPACTSALFKTAGRLKSVVMVLWKSPQARGFPMMKDMWEEFAKEDQATGGQLDPAVNALKWMWEWQCSYTDEQLSFWLLLWPLTDGGKVSSQHLACRLLSVWHWASALDLLTYLPSTFIT